ncbi:MAG: MFS transporter [Acholeplasmatales bacterium]|jgi:MFS family permease|nr:MFS transporter [Acholeplasmatales bacterium]
MSNLKLNKKTTLLIGLAFFATLMVWQIYNNYAPLILQFLLYDFYKDDPKQLLYVVGIIMALDNIVALIVMPVVGILSDKTKTKWGKRMPYIIVGMLATGILFPFIAVCFIYNSLVGVIIFMVLFLVIMQAYRNPVVALMPDVTPKPLRSVANGIINFVGYLGAVLATVLGMIFNVKKEGDLAGLVITPKDMSSAQGIMLYPFLITAVITLVIMLVLTLKLKENKLVLESLKDVEEGEKESQTHASVEKKLSKSDFKNLIFLILSVFLWFMAFNALETFNSLFALNVIGDSGIASTGVIVLTAVSILTFLLCGKLASKIGRKRVVIIGISALIFGFALVAIATFTFNRGSGYSNPLTYFLLGSSAIIGFGWALININSYPMVVELANKDNIGKFTGYYYFGSMLAQSITPIVVGLIMSFVTIGHIEGIKFLYIYSTLFATIALVAFLFVKEAKRNIQAKTGWGALGDPEENPEEPVAEKVVDSPK